MRLWRNWQTRKIQVLVPTRYGGSTPLSRTKARKSHNEIYGFFRFLDLLKPSAAANPPAHRQNAPPTPAARNTPDRSSDPPGARARPRRRHSDSPHNREPAAESS